MATEHVRHHDRGFLIEARGFSFEETPETGLDFMQAWLEPQGAEQIGTLHAALFHSGQLTGQDDTAELAAAREAEREALRRIAFAFGGHRPGQRIIIHAAP